MSHSKPVNVPAALAACGLLDVEDDEKDPNRWTWGPLVFTQSADGGVMLDVDDHEAFEPRGPFYTQAQLRKGVKVLLHTVVKYGLKLADVLATSATFLEAPQKNHVPSTKDT